MNLAVLGAGKVGAAIARTAIVAGHDVTLAGSGSPADIELLVSIVVPGARVARAANAARDADVVILSIPAPKFRTLDAASLAGKIVVDAMNYWPETDGIIPELMQPSGSSSVIAAHLAGARVVKTLNHIGYHELEEFRAPAGAPGRRGLAIVSDDVDAAARVAALIDSLGYDPVAASPLASGVALQPGAPIFGGPFDHMYIRDELAAAHAVIDDSAACATKGAHDRRYGG